MLSEVEEPREQKLALIGEGAGCLYSPNCLEEVFSETGLADY
jgi:hypothetical protein